jgi:hypothetical protein
MKQNFTVRQGALDGVETFLSVAQHRSFRRAAAELGVTPSAVSQAVRALEARVGAALFIRTTRSVGLTEAGERLRDQGSTVQAAVGPSSPATILIGSFAPSKSVLVPDALAEQLLEAITVTGLSSPVVLAAWRLGPIAVAITPCEDTTGLRKINHGEHLRAKRDVERWRGPASLLVKVKGRHFCRAPKALVC